MFAKNKFIRVSRYAYLIRPIFGIIKEQQECFPAAARILGLDSIELDSVVDAVGDDIMVLGSYYHKFAPKAAKYAAMVPYYRIREGLGTAIHDDVLAEILPHYRDVVDGLESSCHAWLSLGNRKRIQTLASMLPKGAHPAVLDEAVVTVLDDWIPGHRL